MKKQNIKPLKEDEDEISHISYPKPNNNKERETSGDDKFDKGIDKLFPKKK